MKLRGIEYNLNCGYNFVIVLFYCVSRVYPLSADRLNFHPNDQGLSSSSGYQGSSSSWNYAYHFNWQSTDHNNPGKGVSRFAETSDSKQYVHPPLAPPLPTPRHHLGINSRTYRHADQNHRIKTNHHVNHHDQVNYHHPGPGDSNAFIENIRNEIMSSFKETLPEHFNGHHDHRPPDYHHHQHQERQQRDYNQRDNILDHYGQPNIPDNLFHGRNFHLPSPPISFTSSHEVKPSSTLKRFQRSHKQNHPLPGPEVAGGISKSSSWNFNSNQGFYYRVDDVDGKKHEEQGSYGDGQRSSGSPPSWINNYHQPNINQQQQLGQQINSIQGFPYGSDNFIFPSNHHHHRNQNQPSIWFQSTFNHNNQDYHRQKVNHGNNYINQKQH